MAAKKQQVELPLVEFDYKRSEENAPEPLPEFSGDVVETELPEVSAELVYKALTIVPSGEKANRFCVAVLTMQGNKVLNVEITEPYSRPHAFEDGKIKFVRLFSGELFEKYKQTLKGEE